MLRCIGMTSRYLFVALLALATCRKSTPARSSSTLSDATPAVVMVVVGMMRDGRFVPSSRGSGTIISSDGRVLTNRHVLFDATNNQLHATFMIGLFRAGQQPDLLCMGDPGKGLHDAQADLSLIRCDRDVDGQPWLPTLWPTITMRETDIVMGEPLWVLGYPAIGEMRIRAGVASGFADGLIRTTATIAHGHSGGAAIDQNGKLIGVPTGFRRRTLPQQGAQMPIGRIGLITPIHPALVLLKEAK